MQASVEEYVEWNNHTQKWTLKPERHLNVPYTLLILCETGVFPFIYFSICPASVSVGLIGHLYRHMLIYPEFSSYNPVLNFQYRLMRSTDPILHD